MTTARPPTSGTDFDSFLGAAEAMRKLGIASNGFAWAAAKHDALYSCRSSVVAVLGIGTQRLRIGRWFMEKFRGRLEAAGPRTVATQLRKQGVPFEIALLALLGCEERFTHLRGAT